MKVSEFIIVFAFNFIANCGVHLAVSAAIGAKKGYFRSAREFISVVFKVARALWFLPLTVGVTIAAISAAVQLHSASDSVLEILVNGVKSMAIFGTICLLAVWWLYLSRRILALALIGEDGEVHPIFGNPETMPRYRKIIFEVKHELGRPEVKGALLIWRSKGISKIVCDAVLLSEIPEDLLQGIKGSVSL